VTAGPKDEKDEIVFSGDRYRFDYTAVISMQDSGEMHFCALSALVLSSISTE
jgi:hypothetical protein